MDNIKKSSSPESFFMKGIRFIITSPIKLVKYFCLGFFFTTFTIVDLVVTPLYNVLFYALVGFITLCLCCYRFIHYAWKGFKTPYIFFHNWRVIRNEKREAKFLEWQEREEKARILHEREAARVKAEMEARIAHEQEEKRRAREAALAERQLLHRNNDNYVNENVEVKKKTFGDQINAFLLKIIAYPKKLKEHLKEKFYNSTIARNRRNKQLMNREVLLVDFDGEDAEKTDEKQLYEYTGKTADGKYVKGYFEAYSRVEVHSFLLSEGMEVYSIKTDKWIRLFHQHHGTTSVKMKNKDLVFFLAQLSTYIKSGIPLVESLRILAKQYKNKGYQRVFRAMIYDLTMGESFSTAMEKQNKTFPSLLINMIKTSEMTGQLPEVLDDQVEYYTEVEKTRKAMISALTYPLMVLFLAIAVIIFIMIWVVPQFISIFESIDGSSIPGITLFILGASNFIRDYWWAMLLVVVLVCLVCWYLYTNVNVVRIFTQWVAMHLPILGNVIIYKEVTLFTKTFASLIEHNVFITDSMEILRKITNNEIYKSLINETIVNLAKGDKISTAFKGHWAFPVPAYEMLVTGEKTGELPQMMKKVSEYYQDLHRNTVTRIKTFIEPVLIIVLTAIVGVIVISIIIPMFEMYNQLQNTTR